MNRPLMKVVVAIIGCCGLSSALCSHATAQQVRIPTGPIKLLQAEPLEPKDVDDDERNLWIERQKHASVELTRRWTQYKTRDGDLLQMYNSIDRVFSTRLTLLKSNDDIASWHEARLELLKHIESIEQQRVEVLANAGGATREETADVAFARYMRVTAEIERKALKAK